MIAVEQFRSEAAAWLAGHAGHAPADYGAICPPELVEHGVAWHRRLHAAGYAGIHWPVDHGGRGLTADHDAAWQLEGAQRCVVRLERPGIRSESAIELHKAVGADLVKVWETAFLTEDPYAFHPPPAEEDREHSLVLPFYPVCDGLFDLFGHFDHLACEPQPLLRGQDRGETAAGVCDNVQPPAFSIALGYAGLRFCSTPRNLRSET